jgi:hypothetical protein
VIGGQKATGCCVARPANLPGLGEGGGAVSPAGRDRRGKTPFQVHFLDVMSGAASTPGAKEAGFVKIDPAAGTEAATIV